jgi:hypothetical protein
MVPGPFHYEYLSEYACCLGAGAKYVIKKQRCAGNVILPQHLDVCNGKRYHIDKARCCGGVLSYLHQETNPEDRCCGNQAYSELIGRCCHHDNGKGSIIGKHFECCGSGKFTDYIGQVNFKVEFLRRM